MKFINKINRLLKRGQKLPEKTKKGILVLIIIVLALPLIYIWLLQAQQRVDQFKSEGFKELKNIPSLKQQYSTSTPSIPIQGD